MLLVTLNPFNLKENKSSMSHEGSFPGC